MGDQIIRQLTTEYPELAGQRLTVERQFAAGVGRPSNTFLICSAGSLGRFVAKSHSTTSQISKLSTEWWALRTVGERAPELAPRLLFPDQEPHDFLLIEYLEGQTGDHALRSGTDAHALYRRIGQQLARLHTIRLDAFGAPESPVPDWIAYVQHKLDERFRGSCRSIDAPLASRTEQLIARFVLALDQERGQLPVLIHRDVYATNVIISPNLDRLTFIDFAMATGGRPFFDFGKLLIDEPTRPPVAAAAFLEGYGLDTTRLADHHNLIQLYVLLELLGQIPYFERLNQPTELNRVIATLAEFVAEYTVT